MERLTQRVERLELDTHQIKSDLAVLTERSQNFATRTDVEVLHTEQLKLRCEMHEGFAQTAVQFARIDEKFARIDEKFVRIDERFERIDERFGQIDAKLERMDKRFERMDEKFERIDMKFERVDEKFDRLNDRITWTLMVPAILAVLGWLVKEVLVKVS
ncbi:hypothetical protein [Pantoea sp. ACRSB]|uniref:hypothetical protein n=1 Tax=Pantoea sp. ACRSB TaxID=2918207 RepID=UPI0028930A98|nr:hypothetical protein [Pantoea sp. ACRSB]MCG7388392.1 hypothetical protein [Pantoea sp. ACRSB]